MYTLHIRIVLTLPYPLRYLLSLTRFFKYRSLSPFPSSVTPVPPFSLDVSIFSAPSTHPLNSVRSILQSLGTPLQCREFIPLVSSAHSSVPSAHSLSSVSGPFQSRQSIPSTPSVHCFSPISPSLQPRQLISSAPSAQPSAPSAHPFSHVSSSLQTSQPIPSVPSFRQFPSASGRPTRV